MALPTLSADQIEDIYVTTFNKKLPDVVDNVYLSNPLIAILNAQERILLDGGRRIEQGIIYGKLNGGFYNRGDTFNTARVNTKTAFILDWKLQYVNVTIDGIDELQNAGAAAAFDSAAMKMQEAELTGKDILGTVLYGNGNDNQGANPSGLEEWIDDGTNFPTMAGITRDTSPQGTAAKAIFDGTGGTFTIPYLQGLYGKTTVENEKPNLIVCPQILWDALSNRVQPQQRYPVGPGFDDLARIGFDALKYQRAAVVVDSHVQTNNANPALATSGRVYGLNTEFIKLIVHSARNFAWRGWINTSNKDEKLGQFLWAGQLVVSGPRFNFQARNVTA
jgi:hypothetical protein